MRGVAFQKGSGHPMTTLYIAPTNRILCWGWSGIVEHEYIGAALELLGAPRCMWPTALVSFYLTGHLAGVASNKCLQRQRSSGLDEMLSRLGSQLRTLIDNSTRTCH